RNRAERISEPVKRSRRSLGVAQNDTAMKPKTNSIKPASGFALVLVTAPDSKVADRLAKAALTRRLVACVNLVPQVKSHYWWQGRIESSAEVLLVMKTTKARLKALETLVRALHPYDTPEFITLLLNRGSERYLDWLAASVESTRGKRSKGR